MDLTPFTQAIRDIEEEKAMNILREFMVENHTEDEGQKQYQLVRKEWQ